MKLFSTSLGLFVLLLVSSGMRAQCTASFVTFVGPNGSVTFTSTAAPTTSVSQYTWYFGNGNAYNAFGNAGITTSQQYTANGNYQVSLVFTNQNPYCQDSITQTIAVTNYTPPGGCSLNAGYSNYLGTTPGSMNFSNNSSGTVATTSYTWNYGDGSAFTYSTNGAHTYSANGNYVVTLFANNNTSITCVDSQTMGVTITNICNSNASFSISNGANGTVNFVSTSTGTTNVFMYNWYFGDGGNASGASSVSHQYLNGVYTATLLITDSIAFPSCTDSATMAITVGNNTCFAQPAFSFTQAANGLVNFSNQSTGSNANTSYNWNFGNGTISNSSSTPSTTYLNGGNYVVTLIMNNGNGCTNTYSQSLAITGVSCTANANFTLNYGGTPGVWNAVPAYPWNVSSAIWSWGDGGYSYNMYGTHNYSVSANYNICLSVVANCGDSATSCSTYSVYRASGANIYQVTVIPPGLKSVDNTNTTGIATQEKLALKVQVMPNPSNGQFMVMTSGIDSQKLEITIHDSMGRLVLTKSQEASGSQVMNIVDLSEQSNGIYFISLQSGTQVVHTRVLLQH